ncbi:hypothetical protein C8N43_2907 [Litoreibacter ponti]|uniref:AAA+ family ATPase n=1 Tax=Litoreibacter ponti TaxID=1510457 RepID=A0A2T6BDJ1_9RHOB|nr:hypothetical protein [Litoreibacter ponti]PTX54102.1 hypothetical protein C8N43_2907 [Litoreibacter ponti]
MKQLLIIAALAMPATALAEEAETPGFGLDSLTPFAEGLRGLMEGLAEDMMPLMEQLADKMSDLNAFEPPEVLPNGDIIIRRKPDAPETPEDAPQVNPDGSIDL